MPPTPYKRVDWKSAAESQQHPTAVDQPAYLRWSVMLLAVLLCVVQAVLTVLAANLANLHPTATMISVIGFGVLILLVLGVNPLLRCVFRGTIQPLTRCELTSLIAAMTVTAGISTFGLSNVLVPIIPAPWNPEWNIPQRGWDTQLLPQLDPRLYITDPEVIRQFREGLSDAPPQDAPVGEWVTFYRRVLTTIPWLVWLRPFLRWMIFIFGCYGIFFCLTYLVLKDWATREKLMFPLVQLAEAVLPKANDRPGAWPAIFRGYPFWIGFAFSFLVLAYNSWAIADVLPLEKINLGMSSGVLNDLLEQSALAGMKGSMSLLVIFTAVGIAFLLPLEISFSVWLYFLAGRLLIYAMVRMGYGSNFYDFPNDWMWAQNPLAAMGMGGLLLFSATALIRSLRASQWSEPACTVRERLTLWMPRIGLIACMIIVTWWIHQSRVPLLWAGVFTLFVTLITLGWMRIVAESGMYWFQSNASFFHFYKMAGLGNFLSPAIAGLLIPIYAVLFFDIKTFLAPNMLNAAHLRQRGGGGRLKFHLTLLMSVIASIVTAVGLSITLAYARGAQRMEQWFYSTGPRHYMEQAAKAGTMQFAVEPATLSWFTIGAVWTGLSLWLRRSIFIFPHPIGFLMNVNPLMEKLWFSFFLGWLIKKLVLKYTAPRAYARWREAMLGMVLGEFMAVFLAGLVTILPMGIDMRGIDLNRYGS